MPALPALAALVLAGSAAADVLPLASVRLPVGPARTVLLWYLVVALLGTSVLLAVAHHARRRRR